MTRPGPFRDRKDLLQRFDSCRADLLLRCRRSGGGARMSAVEREAPATSNACLEVSIWGDYQRGSPDLGDEIHATPALNGGRLSVRTHGTLYCFGAK